MENIGIKIGDRRIIGVATPIIYVYKRKKQKVIFKRYKCECKCGKISIVLFRDLKNRKSDRCKACSQKLRRKILPTGTKLGSRIIIGGEKFIKIGCARTYTYLCKCKCGKITRVTSSYLKKEKHNYCKKCAGNLKKLAVTLPKKIIIGSQIGKWTVTGNSIYKEGKKIGHMFKCTCSCGVVKNQTRSHLLKGQSLECRKCFLKRISAPKKQRCLNEKKRDCYTIQCSTEI